MFKLFWGVLGIWGYFGRLRMSAGASCNDCRVLKGGRFKGGRYKGSLGNLKGTFGTLERTRG